MEKNKKSFIWIGLILLALLIILMMSLYSNHSSKYNPITIGNNQIFDSSDSSIKEGVLSGDFQWQSTGYQYGGIGRIYNFWTLGNPRFGDGAHSSMHTKIEKSNLADVGKNDCESVRYGLNKEFDSHFNVVSEKINNYYSTSVELNDVICFSVDKNKDGIFGDKFFAIQIINKTDGAGFAESVQFIYELLE